MNDKLSRQQTMQQQRAALAWKQVNEIERSSKKGEYGSLVRSLPAMIQTDGLGQTLAFLLAKGKTDHSAPHSVAYAHLQEWLRGQFQDMGNTNLLDWLLTQDSATYRFVTSEAQAYLLWLKRFAEAKDLKSSGKD
jgi:CRISPR-associated protein Cmr5